MNHVTRAPFLVAALLVASGLSLAACSGEMPTSFEASEGAPTAFSQVRANPAAAHTYEVTIENLSSGQIFSPGVAATHTMKTHLFSAGSLASEGIRLIAEEGNPATAVTAAENDSEAFDVHQVGPVLPGTSMTFMVEGKADANRLSLALMLVCTNDGFIGLNSVKLPGGFGEATFYSPGYDAGTEQNEETAESVVDGCPAAVDGSNTRTATAEPIAVHPGIQGGAALDTGVHGWTDPVARITVQRTN